MQQSYLAQLFVSSLLARSWPRRTALWNRRSRGLMRAFRRASAAFPVIPFDCAPFLVSGRKERKMIDE
jgi:hypothetical protein